MPLGEALASPRTRRAPKGRVSGRVPRIAIPSVRPSVRLFLLLSLMLLGQVTDPCPHVQ
jgi:hypothetical protein